MNKCCGEDVQLSWRLSVLLLHMQFCRQASLLPCFLYHEFVPSGICPLWILCYIGVFRSLANWGLCPAAHGMLVLPLAFMSACSCFDQL